MCSLKQDSCSSVILKEQGQNFHLSLFEKLKSEVVHTQNTASSQNVITQCYECQDLKPVKFSLITDQLSVGLKIILSVEYFSGIQDEGMYPSLAVSFCTAQYVLDSLSVSALGLNNRN